MSKEIDDDDLHVLSELFEYDHVIELIENNLDLPAEADFNACIASIKYVFDKKMKRLMDAVIDKEKKHGVTLGGSYDSEILLKVYGDLMDCNSDAQLKAILPTLKAGLLKTMVISFDFELDELRPLAGRGKKFNSQNRGLDGFGKILFRTLKWMGKGVSSAMVLEELRKIVGKEKLGIVIQEIDEDGMIYWNNGSKDKATSFRSMANRLAKIRKKI